MKQWEKDLLFGIRTGTSFDDRDEPDWNNIKGRPQTANSKCNLHLLETKFKEIRDNCTSILEIGIAREKDSFTDIFLRNKRSECHYFGVDIEDKSFLDNPANLIRTIRTSSSNFQDIANTMLDYGVTHIDLLFIDGWHSINQILDDWEFVSMIPKGGIIGIHDTNYHPGPMRLVAALNRHLYAAEICCDFQDDYGITFITKL